VYAAWTEMAAIARVRIESLNCIFAVVVFFVVVERSWREREAEGDLVDYEQVWIIDRSKRKRKLQRRLCWLQRCERQENPLREKLYFSLSLKGAM
jgi:hypothetical protein